MKLLAMDWLMILIDLSVEIEIVLQFWNEFSHVYEWGKMNIKHSVNLGWKCNLLLYGGNILDLKSSN
jgi:homoserine trans-succinylase